jgi:ATP-dependent exoDNAse (exonuclease V) beta subunit
MDEEKSHFEAQRVLYVAVTRAKSRLYLLDNSSKSTKHSFRSLLKKQVFLAEEQPDAAEATAHPLLDLFKLPLSYYASENLAPQPYLNPPVTALSSGIPRLSGIVAHQLLQWICENHPATPTDIPWQLAEYEYKKLGFTPAMQAHALTALQAQIKQLFAHPIGSWIIASHQQEQNEYAILVSQQERTITRIIDRLFEYNGLLWIIDFKTGKEDPTTLVKYQQQLTEYAYYLSSQTNLPIHCGLYYLPTSHWVHWEYEVQVNQM